jgi:hypothetical protein
MKIYHTYKHINLHNTIQENENYPDCYSLFDVIVLLLMLSNKS